MLDIGLEIRILRERLKMSAKELAETVGISQSQISRLEKGERRIDTKLLSLIAAALGVEASYFFRGDSAPAEGAVPPSMPDAVGKLLRAERRRRHLSAEDVASRVGRPKAVIQKVEEGKLPLEPELAEKIMKVLRIGPGTLLATQERTIRGLETQVTRLNEALAEASRGALDLGGDGGGAVERRGIPVLGSLAGGYPTTFDDATGRPVADVQDFVYLPEVNPPDAFALYAVGDSMESASSPSFREGDLLVFASGALRSRDFVFAHARAQGREQAVFRQVFFEMGGRIRMQPLNLNYTAIVLSQDELVAAWRLVGHVSKVG